LPSSSSLVIPRHSLLTISTTMPPKVKPSPSPIPPPTPTQTKTANPKPSSPIQPFGVQESPLVADASKISGPQPGTTTAGKPKGESTAATPKPSTDVKPNTDTSHGVNGTVTEITKSTTTSEKTSIEETVEVTAKKLMHLFSSGHGGKYFLDSSIHKLISDFDPFVHEWMNTLVRPRVKEFIEEHLVEAVRVVRTTTIERETQKWQKEIKIIRDKHEKDKAEAIRKVIEVYEKKMSELDVTVHVKFQMTSKREQWLAKDKFPPEISSLDWPVFEPDIVKDNHQ
jgi:hypothetical protein